VVTAASLWFYGMWQPAYLLVPGACIGAAYVGARMIAAGEGARRRAWLVGAVAVPLGLLLLFKYYNFVADTLTGLSRRVDSSFAAPHLRLALPVGISFFTFKTLSYLADVHKGRLAPESNLLRLSAYISFFPQILAGPIERAGAFLPQLDRTRDFDYARVTNGLALMLWGLFKKAVIADRLAVMVNQVYSQPGEFTGLPLIVATYAYAFQIYCDFSGYSDMAIGAGRVLGFTTMRNFARPYESASVGEFWRRWHISLSSWFRDYVYIPLGGSRVSKVRWARNVLVVFLISGLWHGSAWTFILWGALHGLYLIGERALRPVGALVASRLGWGPLAWLGRPLKVFLTFNLISFAWIFFRAPTVSEALYIAGHLFEGLGRGLTPVVTLFNPADLLWAIILITILEAVHAIQRRGSAVAWMARRPLWIRWAVYAALVLGIINLRPHYAAQFIYLQF
jgi:D-alanyl-lipoteichoic acid acyltransferase DltB (MBOAT superfamily)